MNDTDQNTNRLPEDVQQKTDFTAETEPNSEKRFDKKNITRVSGKSLAGLALLISVGAITFSSYIGWHALSLEQSQPILLDGIEQLQTQVARQQAKLTTVAQNVSTDIMKQKEQLQAQQQRDAKLLSRIDILTTKVRELEGSTRGHWRLAEIEYLLRIANQRLLTVNDVTSSLVLMASAEQILEQMDDYSLFPVREALAEDIAVLKATEILNQEDIWFRLQAIASLIPDLIILDDSHISDITSTQKPELTVTDEANPPANRTWQETIKAIFLNTWHQFAGLFRINTQRKQPIEELLTPEQGQLIRQKMLMLIEQSKLALITGQQSIYQNSLRQTSDWLNRYFMLGGNVNNWLEIELADLETLPITPKMPNIHRALDALKKHQSSISPTLKREKVAPSDSENKAKPAPPKKGNNKDTKPVTEPDQSAEQEQGGQIS